MKEKILDYFWLQPVSILFFSLFSLMAYCALPADMANDKKVIIAVVLFLVIAIYSWYVYKNSKMPSATEGVLGVLFIYHSKNEGCDDACDKIQEYLREKRFSHNKVVKPIFVHIDRLKRYDLSSKDSTNKLLQDTNCVFWVDLTYIVDDVSNAKNYELMINLGTVHPNFDESITKFYEGEIRRVSQPIKKNVFTKDNKLNQFKIITTHINFLVKYIVSLVCFFDENYISSYELLKELFSEMDIENKTFFDVVKKFYYVTCWVLESKDIEKYFDTGNPMFLDSAEKYLEEYNSLYANTYGYHLDMAVIDFLKYRNLKSARNHVELCKGINSHDTWKYSDAFLYAYESVNLNRVIKRYENAMRSDYDCFQIATFIENCLEKEPEKYIFHLVLGLLYHKLEMYDLTILHLGKFNERHVYLPSEKRSHDKIEKLISEISA